MEETKNTKKIEVPEAVTVGDLANRLNIPVSKIIAELMKNGVLATINEYIDYDTAEIISEYLGFEIKKEAAKAEEKAARTEETHKGKTVVSRPPIIAVLGHVDHGKTSLLDAIRETNIVQREHGGITQHIGAYQVERAGRRITFLDTPGHAAFEKMRQHGAELTDIALIIVAADDGVKPQTVEAINHAKRADTPVIVVISKIDKPEADQNRVKQQMAELGLVPEEWGGDTLTTAVSSKTKEGIDELLDLILVMSDLKDFKADPKAPATGVVIETRLDVGKGPVATILMKNGTLRVGDFVGAGETYGKIRSMEDYRGRRVKEAGPAMPVRISGLKSLPGLADIVQSFPSEKEAKAEVEKEQRNKGIHQLARVKKIGLEELSQSMDLRERKELGVVLKADVKGSLNAIKQSFEKFSNEEVRVKIVSEGVGAISEGDVSMAKTSDNIVLGFNVPVNAAIDQLAKREKVKIYNYNVIYQLLDDVRNLLSDMLSPEIKEITLGRLDILKVFSHSKGKMIIGGKVKEGKIEKNTDVKLFRKDQEVGRAKVVEVRREKDEIKEAQVGTECGVSLDKDLEVLEGDTLETFRTEEIKRTI